MVKEDTVFWICFCAVVVAWIAGILVGSAAGGGQADRRAAEKYPCAVKCGGWEAAEVKDGACWCREEVR